MTALFPQALTDAANDTLQKCRARKLTLTTVESCTGGLISGCLTDIPGSSDVIDRGYITYAYQAKIDLVGVKLETLQKHGAVSLEVCEEMAVGARNAAKTDIAVAVTGIAGPGGATETKPIGLVYISIATKNGVRSLKNNFSGDRTDVRLQTVLKALQEVAAETEKA